MPNITKTAFHASWNAVGKTPVKSTYPNPVVLRNWQNNCFNKLKDRLYRLITAMTGSGKTLMIKKFICEEYNSDKKIIVCAPTTAIGMGFGGEIIRFETFDSTIIDYEVLPSNNLCRDYSADNTNVNRFVNFLKNDAIIDLSDRIIVCTHQTMVGTYKELKNTSQLHLLANTILWVDEAHHVAQDEIGLTNQLGEVISYFFDNNIPVGQATATPYRTDRVPIIPTRYRNMVESFYLDAATHFTENCGGLTFKYDFLLSEKKIWTSALDDVFKKKIGKTIVYIPHPHHKVSSGDKFAEVAVVFRHISGVKKGEEPQITFDQNEIILVKRKNKIIKVLDLVSEDHREKKLAYLKDHSDDIDVVLGVNVPKEGFDWPAANREIIVGVKKSRTEMVQILGRTFRGHPDKSAGKIPIEIIHIIPWVDPKQLDKDETREQLNNFMKCIYLSLMAEMDIDPINIKIRSLSGVRDSKDEGVDVTQYAKEKLGEDGYSEWFEDIMNQLISFEIEHLKESREFYDTENARIISESLDKLGIVDFHEELSSFVTSHLRRRTHNTISELKKVMENNGFDVSLIDKDIMKEVSPLGFITGYTNLLCGANNLREVKELVDGYCFLPFEEARDFARTLELKNTAEWKLYSKTNRPNNIPSSPDKIYKNKGWIDWTDFLWTNRIDRKYISFEKAKDFVSKFGLKSCAEWDPWYTKNNYKNIPRYPDVSYRNKGWNGWPNFLNNGNINNKERKYLPFEEARNLVRKLKLKNQKQWSEWSKHGRPQSVPSDPYTIYKDKGWMGMGDWLGTGYICSRNREYLPFEKARNFTNKLGLKNQKEWFVWHKQNKPINIPCSPALIYKNEGWNGFGHWLGTGYICQKYRKYLSFEESKIFVRTLKLNNSNEWRIWHKENNPKNIPRAPHVVYRYKGWVSYGDWIGNGYIACNKREYLRFEEARDIVRKLKLNDMNEWRIYAKNNKLKNIPSSPYTVYKDSGWISMGDWLGNGNIRINGWIPFEKARKFVRSLRFKTKNEWLIYLKTNRPNGIPVTPNEVYKNNGWVSWPDWLGTI